MKHFVRVLFVLALSVALQASPVFAGGEGGSGVGGGGGEGGSGVGGGGGEGGSGVGGGGIDNVPVDGNLADRGVLFRLEKMLNARSTTFKTTCIAAVAEMYRSDSRVHFRAEELEVRDVTLDFNDCMEFGARIQNEPAENVEDRRTLVRIQGVDLGFERQFDSRHQTGF